MPLSVALLHHPMINKQQEAVTTSLTPVDIHDIARTCRTFNAHRFFIAHPSPSLRQMARIVMNHWIEGTGREYNPNRAEAFSLTQLVESLDEAIALLHLETGVLPHLVATSAKGGDNRTPVAEFRRLLETSPAQHYLLLLGTGWGMTPALIERSSIILSPISGNGAYNHLSVRSACAILLDRILGQR